MSARMAGTVAETRVPLRPDPDWDLDGPHLLLGLRLLAWAIAVGAAAFLPPESLPAVAWIGAALAGSTLAALGVLAPRGSSPLLTDLVIVAQVGVWATLMQFSGGPQSPLFVGFLLEIALGAAWRGLRGGSVAAAAAAVYVVLSAGTAERVDSSRVFISLGCLALTAVIAVGTAAALARQRVRIAEANSLLRQRALSLAEEMRTLEDYLGTPLFALDDLGRVASANRAALTMLGVGARAALGQPWQAVLGPDDAGRAAIARALADGSPQNAARFDVVAHGGIRTVRADIWSTPTPDGTRTYVLLRPVPGGDVESDPARRAGEAVACVSHQIRNALARLQGMVAGADGAGPASAPLAPAVHSLIELCENVLAFGEPPSAAISTVSLADTVTSAIALAGPPAARVRMLAAAEPLRVRVPRGPLVHAVYNLIDNACRATPEPGDVTVSVARLRGNVIVEVCDQGPGMPAGAARGDGAARGRDGHGYGLLAARRFAESCGGRVEFDRPAAGGTRARLLLGCAPEGC